MPSLAEYKEHYPNLTTSQNALLRAARVAAGYSKWGSLNQVRTLGLRPWVFEHPVNILQEDIAQSLLNDEFTQSYEPDVLHYPRMNGQTALLSSPAEFGIADLKVKNPDWVVCKEVKFHVDDVDCDIDAYVFYCVKATEAMTLNVGGNTYPMVPGTMVVFDPRLPHALFGKGTVVGMIGSTPITDELRVKLGIEFKRPGKNVIPSLEYDRGMNLDPDTGSFTGL